MSAKSIRIGFPAKVIPLRVGMNELVRDGTKAEAYRGPVLFKGVPIFVVRRQIRVTRHLSECKEGFSALDIGPHNLVLVPVQNGTLAILHGSISRLSN